MTPHSPIVSAASSPRAALARIPRLLLRPDEAAAACGLSPRALWKLTRDGAIPAVRLGKLVRYAPDALRRAFAEHDPTANP